MILTANQQSLSPDTFGDDMKMFAKTGSTTSSGYCSSPQASDESFDGDKLDYFGSSYKMWGDSTTNSEHIAHNILSQLFEEERIKSPGLTNALSGDSGIVWSNDYQNASETQSSPLSAFSDENSESAFMQWGTGGGKQLAPGSHLRSQLGQSNFGQSNFGQSNPGQGNFGQSNLGQSNGGWPTSLHTSSAASSHSLASNSMPNAMPNSMPNSMSNNMSNSMPSNAPNPSLHYNNHHPYNSNNNSAPHFNNIQPLGMSSLNGMPNLNGMPGGSLSGIPGGNGLPGGNAAYGGFVGSQGSRGGMHGMMQSSRGMPGGLPPVDVLQQSILRRKIAEQTFMGNVNDVRCFPSSPNKLYPTSPTSISLSHHKKLPLSFNQVESPLPTHQPQISPDSKLLLTTIETCWSQLLQLNRGEKKCEFEVSSLFKDFVKPTPIQPKPKSPFKLDLLIQNTEATHAMILSFVENVEKVSQSALKMKGNIVKYIASLDEICREMLELRRQIHPVHGLGNDETIRKLIQTLELYSKQSKLVRSNLYMMVTALRNSKNN